MRKINQLRIMWRRDGILSFLCVFSLGAVPPEFGWGGNEFGALEIRAGMATGWVITSPAVEKERRALALPDCPLAPGGAGHNNAAANQQYIPLYLLNSSFPHTDSFCSPQKRKMFLSEMQNGWCRVLQFQKHKSIELPRIWPSKFRKQRLGVQIFTDTNYTNSEVVLICIYVQVSQLWICHRLLF